MIGYVRMGSNDWARAERAVVAVLDLDVAQLGSVGGPRSAAAARVSPGDGNGLRGSCHCG